MILIKEYRDNNEVYFEYQVMEENKILFTNDIYYKSVLKDLDGNTFLMLYNTRMKVISSVFSFLNFYVPDQSINSRIKSLQALKLLYSFQDIINKELNDFTYADITNLKHFLRWVSPKGKIVTFELLSFRNNETINGTWRYIENLLII